MADGSGNERDVDAGALIEVTEHTDPICSWAWGTEPKLRLLRWRYDHRLVWRVVMGGLVGDASGGRADWDPVLAARPMSAYWRRTTAYTGQPYPSPMHRMARSTDPAGRAVKAALRQGTDVADRVLRRVREQVFVFGATPETPDQFAVAVAGVPGLDIDRFIRDLADPAVAEAYQADWEETRRPNDHVRHLTGDQIGIGSMKHSEGHDRYAFPTIIVRGPLGEATVPGWMPMQAYVDALESVAPGSTGDPRPDPTVVEAFERWGVLTEQELRAICGPDAEAELPDDVVAHFWGAGLVWFTAAEAAARGLPPLAPRDGRALADLVAALELARAQVDQVPDDGWSGPTPCCLWDVRALVNHMTGSARMVTWGLTARTIDASFGRDHVGDDPRGAYGAAVDELVGVLRSDPGSMAAMHELPWANMRGADFALMFAGDHLVHAWDVARSLGLPTSFDDRLVARVRSATDDYVATHRGPGMFDPATEAPAGASAMDHLAAYVGRVVG
jgi:uncharacterized protein (TIGR03086 family)